MKLIYILGLHNVRTGGPEAIHQLSDALIEQGFDARMVYYEWPQIYALEKLPVDDAYVFGARTNPIEEYAHYKVNVFDAVPNSEDAIVVLPETLCHLAPKFPKATVLIWWLSVDNAFASLARVNLNHLRKERVISVAQSGYAEDFIETLMLNSLHGMLRLSDYSADLSAYAKPLAWEERPRLVAFNFNHKVIADVDGLIRGLEARGVRCLRINGMDRSQVAEWLAQARVYVDLGCFPGKDRLPREASRMGCNVLTSGSGAADEFENFAGRIETAADIVAALGEPLAERAASIAEERETFFREVRDVFSGLNANFDLTDIPRQVTPLKADWSARYKS